MATPEPLPQEPPPPPVPAAAAEPAEESQTKSERRRRLCRYLLTALCVVGFLALLALILWASLSANNVDASVDSASLSAFNLSSSNATLRYNLSVRFNLRRTSRGLAGLHFDRLLAEAYYNGDYLIHSAGLPGFSRRTKRSKWMEVVLAGETSVQLGRSGAELFRRQEKEGRFNIQMRLSCRLTNMLGSLKTKERSYRVRCWLEGLRPDGSKPRGIFGSTTLWSQKCKPY